MTYQECGTDGRFRVILVLAYFVIYHYSEGPYSELARKLAHKCGLHLFICQGLNSGLHACKAGSVLLEPCLQPFLLWLNWRYGPTFLPRPA
jgi:hypothetical protein